MLDFALESGLDVLMNTAAIDNCRSTIAKKIFSLAKQHQINFFHYEYRWQIPFPEQWLPTGIDTNQNLEWQSGILSEDKYQTFRQDALFASFHPGQSSKWGAHELCHRLLGFAWKPNADLFYHSLAAWVAEILPVAIFYFWDEADAFKCPKHKDFSYASSLYCHDCERFGSHLEKSQKPEMVEQALHFIEHQIQAVEASMSKGALVEAPYLFLNLSKDAYDYALSNHKRLCSSTYESYMKDFFSKDAVLTSSIEDLIARLRLLTKSLVDDQPYDIKILSINERKRLDLIWRTFELSQVMDPSSSDQLLKLLPKLETWSHIESFIDGYRQLQNEMELPELDEFFGCGYEVNKTLGFSYSQMRRGLMSLLPTTFNESQWADFLAADREDRRYLGERIQVYISSSDEKVENFFNFAPAFFPQEFRPLHANQDVQLSRRMHLVKNSNSLKNITGIEDPYYLLYKNLQGDILSYGLAQELWEKLLALQNRPLKQDSLGEDLEQMDEFIENGFIVGVN